MFPRYLADIPPPTGQTRDFNYCIRLDNQTDYPNYLIVAKISSRSSQEYFSDPIVLNPGTCLPMGRVLYRPQITLFAVPKSKVSPDDLFKLEFNRFSQLRIVDPEGNSVGIIDKENSQYFNPKAQEQAQQRDPRYGVKVREGDRVLPIEREHSGTVLKSAKVLASNGIPAKVLASNGIPASPVIRKPGSAPFWDSGRTIEGHYTISTLTDQTFTIKESRRVTNGMGMDLLVLPLLGVILLVMVKWYHQRSQLNPSNQHSKTSNNP